MAGESARATAREDPTARALAGLSSDGWRIFHDVRWPGRVHANIDHVLVGPSGVFVIDSKAWSGTIEVRGGALRQDGRRRARHVIAAAAAAMAIGELLPGIEPRAIHPVICFICPEPVFGWSGDTMICSTQNVVAFVSSRPRVLDATKLAEVSEVLATSLQAAAAPVPTPLAVYGDAPAAVATPGRSVRREPRLPIRVPRGVRVTAKIAAVAVAVALAFQLDLPARVGDLASAAWHRVLAPTQPIGTTMAVPGLGSRPSLHVTARSPVVTRSTVPGVQPTRGQQLVAVPVRVQNTGDRTWALHGGLDAVLTDAAGASYSSDPAYTSVSAGRALGPRITVPAGQSTSGLVVFEVPRGTRVSDVQLRVGPSLPTILKWSVE